MSSLLLISSMAPILLQMSGHAILLKFSRHILGIIDTNFQQWLLRYPLQEEPNLDLGVENKTLKIELTDFERPQS